MDIDLDLPVPPKPPIDLDDDIDLPVPVAKAPINLDDDDDLDVAVPAARPAINLDDDDDLDVAVASPVVAHNPFLDDDIDLPVPAAGSLSNTVTLEDDLPSAGSSPAPGAPKPAIHVDPASGGTADVKAAVKPDSSAAGRRKRRSINDIRHSGYLMKQQPTWPHSSQKRWVVLKGRTLRYFEAENSQYPMGTMDLTGAELVEDVARVAKLPNSFGLTGTSGMLKGRIVVFAPTTREDAAPWKGILESVLKKSGGGGLHWFDKMAQGTNP